MKDFRFYKGFCGEVYGIIVYVRRYEFRVWNFLFEFFYVILVCVKKRVVVKK